jgi:kumamolisin
VGTNDFYPAGPGYDMVTGIGTPNAWNLTRDLASLVGRS